MPVLSPSSLDNTQEAQAPAQKPNKALIVGVKQERHHAGTGELCSRPPAMHLLGDVGELTLYL